ncbi:MAG TPA: tellurite resistance/C4-dicarboxylate transporter family protein [Candidatus Nanopelagicales bacterium]|jgi:tellurite resistance protein TehA-like permease
MTTAQPVAASARAGAVRGLLPGYFALVMSTGMVSIGLNLHDWHAASVVLLWLSVVCFVILLVATVLRFLRFRAELVGDLSNPERAFGFFTIVAAIDVVGTRLVIDGHNHLAGALLAAALVVWLVLGYVIPVVAVLGRRERPVINHTNGTWFIWAVASQSVTVLAATLQPTGVPGTNLLALIAVFSWSLGVFLYAVVGILLIVRLTVYPFGPQDIQPPYWVAMGATAITVLAGSRIVAMEQAPTVDVTRGLVAGLALLFWCFGTWLIPALLAIGWWRHITHHIPIRYEPAWWSLVFPVAMYGVGSHYLGVADHLPIVTSVGDVVIWVAVAVWALTFVAMLAHLWRSLVASQ